MPQVVFDFPSTVFSALNSLTLSPALAAILLKKKDERQAREASARPAFLEHLRAALAFLFGFFWLFNSKFDISHLFGILRMNRRPTKVGLHSPIELLGELTISLGTQRLGIVLEN